jgi:hypothetical protein
VLLEAAIKKKFSAIYMATFVLADAVNGATSTGRLAKEAVRSLLKEAGITVPSSLATRTVKKAAKKRASKKKP